MKKFTALLCILAMLTALFAVTASAESSVRLGAMTGPTGMGMGKLFQDADNGESRNSNTYTIMGAADELTPLVLQGELDIVSVPPIWPPPCTTRPRVVSACWPSMCWACCTSANSTPKN